jgi:hypothetical protein
MIKRKRPRKTIADAMDIKPIQIEAQLFSTFVATADSFPIHSGCEQMMRDLIHDGVTFMIAPKKSRAGRSRESERQRARVHPRNETVRSRAAQGQHR